MLSITISVFVTYISPKPNSVIWDNMSIFRQGNSPFDMPKDRIVYTELYIYLSIFFE